MCMPTVPEDIFMEAIAALVALDKDWVPSGEDASLHSTFHDCYRLIRWCQGKDKYAFSIFTCPLSLL